MTYAKKMAKHLQTLGIDLGDLKWKHINPFIFCVIEGAADYFGTRVEDIPCPHHKDEHIILDIDWKNISKDKRNKDIAFLHLLEVYIDDFIGLIQSTNEEEIT